jgi:hypothetical protein
VAAAAGLDLSPEVAPVWAFRLEGSKDEILESVPVIGGEMFAQLKDRIARAIAIDPIVGSSAKSDLRWVAGMRVVHPEFGPGKLEMMSRKAGALHRATVLFDSGRREMFDFDGSGLTRE